MTITRHNLRRVVAEIEGNKKLGAAETEGALQGAARGLV